MFLSSDGSGVEEDVLAVSSESLTFMNCSSSSSKRKWLLSQTELLFYSWPVFFSAFKYGGGVGVKIHFMFSFTGPNYNILRIHSRRSSRPNKVSNHNDGVTGASLFAFNDLFLR